MSDYHLCKYCHTDCNCSGYSDDDYCLGCSLCNLDDDDDFDDDYDPEDMKICQALITSVPKRGKARSIRPIDTIIYSESGQELPVCGGQITFTVEATGGCSGGHGDDYCYCGPHEIHVDATCTNCQRAWCAGIEQLIDKDATDEITRLLNG